MQKSKMQTVGNRKVISFEKSLIFPIWSFQKMLNISSEHSFKGYLRYKTITSQNVPFEAHVMDFFWFHRKFMFRSRDILIFLTIPWFTKSVTSWWVLAHKTGCIFEYIFWTTTHKSPNLAKWYKQGQ